MMAATLDGDDKDALRLLAVHRIADEICGIDLHSRACELAGGNEPGDAEYLKATREAMDRLVKQEFFE